MAHGLPYVATATVADLHDLEEKVEAAMAIHGARYLHVLVPCPLGWVTNTGDTVLLARLAKESGLFPVFEARDGEVTAVSPIRRRVSVEDYLRLQGRYRHLFSPERQADVIQRIQSIADANVARYRLVTEPEEDLR
jgi:pyruvate ferredoxin oxidoreductase beta subunit